MKKSHKYLAIGSGVSAVAMAAAGIGYAATLNATSATAGAKQAVVSSCAAGAVSVAYGTPTDPSGTGWIVTGTGGLTVTLQSSDATTCAAANAKIYVDLSNGSSVLVSGPAAGTPVVNGTTSYAITLGTFTAGKSMADVTAVDITIQ